MRPWCACNDARDTPRRRRQDQSAKLGLANARRDSPACVSNTGSEIAGRAADDLEHVGGGGLLLQRLAQLVEQAGVLDGDDGLRGEVLDQLDLFIGERANLLAVDPDYPYHFVVLDHRDADQGACAGKLDGGGAHPIRVSERGFDVGNLDRSLRFENLPHGQSWVGTDHRFAAQMIPICGGCAVRSGNAEAVGALAQP